MSSGSSVVPDSSSLRTLNAFRLSLYTEKQAHHGEVLIWVKKVGLAVTSTIQTLRLSRKECQLLTETGVLCFSVFTNHWGF